MKSSSVHSINKHVDKIYEKKYVINKSISDSFFSASQSGFSGFIRVFTLILFLEVLKVVTGTIETFRFDIIDISISLAGFIYKFLFAFFNSYTEN